MNCLRAGGRASGAVQRGKKRQEKGKRRGSYEAHRETCGQGEGQGAKATGRRPRSNGARRRRVWRPLGQQLSGDVTARQQQRRPPLSFSLSPLAPLSSFFIPCRLRRASAHLPHSLPDAVRCTAQRSEGRGAPRRMSLTSTVTSVSKRCQSLLLFPSSLFLSPLLLPPCPSRAGMSGRLGQPLPRQSEQPAEQDGCLAALSKKMKHASESECQIVREGEPPSALLRLSPLVSLSAGVSRA